MLRATSFLLLALLANSAPFTAASPVNSGQNTTLQWKKCPSESGWPSDFTCTEFTVPVDWEVPDGPKITLFMNRAPSTSQNKRIGSLFVNPGGPGGSATDLVNELVTLPQESASANLRNHFDLIGLDPRAVGLSTPTRCNPDLWNKRTSKLPKSESAFNEMLAHYRAIGLDCMAQTGPSFNHSDTISAARDMEAARVALGEGPLNYMGFSYGSQLGSQYAELFPGNIRAMVLDANTDHSVNETSFSIDELRDFETVLDHFIEWATTNDTSPLKGKDVGAMVDDLFTKADATPVPAPGCKQDNSTSAIKPCRPDVTGEEMKYTIQDLIIFPFNYPALAQAFVEAFNGNATMMSQPWYTAPTHQDFSQLAIACQDWYHSSTWAEWVNRDNLLRSASPRLQGVTWTVFIQAMCQSWASPLANPPKPLNVTHTGVSNPILLVNAFWDPQTPYSMAVNMQRGIQDSVLLSRKGDGHSSYSEHGATSRAMDDYLINLKLPAVGTVYDT
ncbi:hypothetical protein CLAIMM_11665 [Cladophialophora immunda]|nr:hypothetical protein CLAIMM_11665 [Cladophialophora immunda]